MQLCLISPNREFLLQFIWGAVIRTSVVVRVTFAFAMSTQERAHYDRYIIFSNNNDNNVFLYHYIYIYWFEPGILNKILPELGNIVDGNIVIYCTLIYHFAW